MSDSYYDDTDRYNEWSREQDLINKWYAQGYKDGKAANSPDEILEKFKHQIPETILQAIRSSDDELARAITALKREFKQEDG